MAGATTTPICNPNPSPIINPVINDYTDSCNPVVNPNPDPNPTLTVVVTGHTPSKRHCPKPSPNPTPALKPTPTLEIYLVEKGASSPREVPAAEVGAGWEWGWG